MRGGVTDAGQPNNEQTVKIELLSQWKLEAEFRNWTHRIGALRIGANRDFPSYPTHPIHPLIAFQPVYTKVFRTVSGSMWQSAER